MKQLDKHEKRCSKYVSLFFCAFPKLILKVEEIFLTFFLKEALFVMRPKKNDFMLYIYFGVIVTAIAVFLSFHVGYLMTLSSNSKNEVISFIMPAFNEMMNTPFCVFPLKAEYCRYTGTFIFLVLCVIFLFYTNEKKNEHANDKTAQGSAKWNTKLDKYNKKYSDPPKSKKHDGPRNMILSNDVFLNMDTKRTFINNNILITGGSGSGKSRYVVKPNLLQANCNYVITDPSGELLASCGSFLEKQGYEIKVFNLVDMNKSNCYNPFMYIRDDNGVLQLINCLIKNTNNGKSGGDPFWEKSETALLQALVFYLKDHRSKEEQNFTSVMKLLRAAVIDEDNPNAKSPLDTIFESIGSKNPNDLGYKSYQTFKMGAGKTLKSILISCAVRLNVFDIPDVANLTNTDNIKLGEMGDTKQALFVILPAADDTFNFLASLMYSQLFETLYFHAEKECPKGFYINNPDGTRNCFVPNEEEAAIFLKEHKGCTKEHGNLKLAHHVRFMLDEFANIGLIPNFEKKLATMRKYEISCTIILQNIAQLEALYEKSSDDLIGNCDTYIFLGGSDKKTLTFLSEKLGKTTIKVRNTSRSNGKSTSSNQSFNLTGRELMNTNELSLLDANECIVTIRGINPFLTKKYDYPNHPNYKYTGDADKKNIYKIKQDNSKPLSLNDLEKVTEEEKKNAVIGDTLSTEDFVKENGITAKNIKSRFKSETPDSEKRTVVVDTKEQKIKRTKENEKVLNVLNNKDKKRKETENFASNIASIKVGKETPSQGEKVADFTANRILKDEEPPMINRDKYTHEEVLETNKDFSQQKDDSYEKMAGVKKKNSNFSFTQEKKEQKKKENIKQQYNKSSTKKIQEKKKEEIVEPDVVLPDADTTMGFLDSLSEGNDDFGDYC